MFFCKIALLVVSATFVICSRDVEVKTEEDLGVKYANTCEVCKVLAMELQSSLDETGKVRDVIEIGYSLDDIQPKKKTKYQKSELRLIESIEGVCERILEYNIHKERQDSTRFAKGMSQTFKTLHGLVDKGVKVDLGIPYELWDKPSAEITQLKSQCETLLENNEAVIEDWYWNLQGKKDLKVHLCLDHALKDADKGCMYEDQKNKDSQESKNDPKPKETVKPESGSSVNMQNSNAMYDNENIGYDELPEQGPEHNEPGKMENVDTRGEKGDRYELNDKVWIPEELKKQREEL
ncbi:protein canopy 4 [Bicyclus anynana]|uniref:Protein canopy 4 n=1 Tax=Bicyclus anynana TaxID=110368 RepID=A0A6J1MUL5_BICAN|nr:protein canopy 4 [Bicyclus anynana]